MTTPLLTPSEVAAWLGVSRAWVSDHTRRREPILPSVKMGKLRRYQRDQVEAFIVECQRIVEGRG